MKNYFKIYLALSLYLCCTLSACLNDSKPEKSTTHTPTQQENANDVVESNDFVLPEYKSNLSAIQLKSEIESQVEKFENNITQPSPRISVLDKDKENESEVKIWRNPTLNLLKIERKIKLHKGSENSTFTYYLYNDKLWYADQVYDKYIFEDNKLKYWMDEAFDRRIVADKLFLQREKELLQEVETLLNTAQ